MIEPKANLKSMFRESSEKYVQKSMFNEFPEKFVGGHYGILPAPTPPPLWE